jgi:Family of unknown function (DUF6364)
MSTLISKNKLTLWLDRDVIAFGKAEAKRHRKSLSAMFVEFIQNLRKSQKPQKLSPRIKRLKGVLKGKTIGKDDYYHHLEKKHLAHG